MKLQFFKDFNQNLQTVKKRFKELAFLHHPDRGGNTATMQAVNGEYEYIIKNQLFTFANDYEKENYNEAYELRYPDIIIQLMQLPALEIELCGNWLWIGGVTYPVRKELSKIGCLFSPKKLMWYYRPEDFKHGKNKKTVDIDTIRHKYGSTPILEQEKRAQIM